MRVGRLNRVTGCEKAEMASPPRRVSADLGRPGRPETGHKEIKCLLKFGARGEVGLQAGARRSAGPPEPGSR